MPKKRRNSGSFYSNHVGNVEQTASGKWRVRARKRKIPNKEQEITVDTLEMGKARLTKLDKLYLKKVPVPLSDIPDSELQAAERAREDFYGTYKNTPQFEFSEVVAAGLESLRLKDLREELPSIKEAIDWFHEFRKSPEAKIKGRGAVSKKSQRKEKQVISKLFERAANGINARTKEGKKVKQKAIDEVLSRSVGELFDGTFFVEATGENWFEFCTNHLTEQTTQQGQPMGLSARSAQAMTLRTFCAAVMNHNRAKLPLPHANPLQDLPKNHRYKRDTDSTPTFQKPDKVKALFKLLCKDAKDNPTITDKRKKGNLWDLIPYFALVYFSGRRQSEIAFWDEAYRRLNWSQFKSWTEPSDVSGGYLFSIPAFDEKGRRTAKKDVATPADLHEVGVKWLRYYFEGLKGQSLPENGVIWFSTTYAKKIRRMLNFEENDIRHTFVSAAMKAFPREAHYWHRHCAHNQEVAMSDYQNLMLSKPEADEFFRIDPVSIVGWDDVTRRLFDPDGMNELLEIEQENQRIQVYDDVDWRDFPDPK